MLHRVVRAWTGYQFEILWAIVCLLVGLPLASGLAPSPTSVNALLPVVHRIVWGISLTLGGGLTLFGILWRHLDSSRFIPGLYVERAGLFMLGTSAAVFVVVLWFYAGAPSLYVAAVYGAFIAACISRTRSIGTEINIIREHGGTDA